MQFAEFLEANPRTVAPFSKDTNT